MLPSLPRSHKNEPHITQLREWPNRYRTVSTPMGLVAVTVTVKVAGGGAVARALAVARAAAMARTGRSR